VTTLAKQIDPQSAENPDQVKVVLAKNQNALYFSRAQIPFHRSGKSIEYFGHIGLYGFRMDVLEEFVKLKPCVLEKREKLEQLRLLENNIPIHVVITRYESIGVDRPEDIDAVIRTLSRESNG
jgi:3-deoxy-manno-octulosonate cytidylyltransferase (CMP-KDO synthetase)